MVAVELRFDRKSTEQLLDLWESLQEIYGSPRLTELGALPHISLTLFQHEEPGLLREALDSLSQNCQPFQLAWESAASFPTSEGVVYLSPQRSQDLLLIHSGLHQRLKEGGFEGHHYYTPENWVPHCTVATDVPSDQIPLVVERANEAVGGSVRVEGVTAVAYRPARELYRFEFSRRRNGA